VPELVAHEYCIVIRVFEHGSRRAMVEEVRPGRRTDITQHAISPIGLKTIHAGGGRGARDDRVRC
jgi:hypothetical protein